MWTVNSAKRLRKEPNDSELKELTSPTDTIPDYPDWLTSPTDTIDGDAGDTGTIDAKDRKAHFASRARRNDQVSRGLIHMIKAQQNLIMLLTNEIDEKATQ